jgi:hypothetical protein
MPRSIQDRSLQVEQLVVLAKRIDTTVLDDSFIDSVLSNCISEARRLQEMLQALQPKFDAGKVTRMWKAVVSVSREAELLDLLQALERWKSLLEMAINLENNKAINRLEFGIGEVQSMLTALTQERGQSVSRIPP